RPAGRSLVLEGRGRPPFVSFVSSSASSTLPLPHNPLDPPDHPLSEPTPPTAEPTPVASPDPAPPPAPSAEGAAPAAVVAEPAIEGERLPVPYGATRVVADYGRPRASYVFLALVSITSLAADVASKSWADRHLDSYPGTFEIWKN